VKEKETQAKAIDINFVVEEEQEEKSGFPRLSV
jgi:hypothetical protein